ncbi:MAG TPA: dienelactone hydrolase family protein [Candidatus Baltobacteraceae bacterium]
MLVKTEFVDLPTEKSPMRTMIARPADEGRHPGLLLYTDIFQLTESMQRAIVRFASYGFVVAAPEIYHRFEKSGRAFAFVEDYDAAEGAARQLHVSDVDEDRRVALAYLAGHPNVGTKSLHALGFCIGGHLAFRAALEPEVRSTVCFYPTGLDDGNVGADTNVDSLMHAGEIKGDLLVICGTNDPRVPLAARRIIDDSLRKAGTRYQFSEYEGAHAFMRDVGERYNPSETDRAVAQTVSFLHAHT